MNPASQIQPIQQGPSPADVQLMEAAERYLVQKPVLMSNPGTKLDDVYYSAINTRVDLSEVTFNNGRLSLALPGLTFGGSSQVVIPNSSLLSEVYLHLELDLGSAANVTLPRGWGYAALASINYQMGSSNANQQQISGQSVWQIISAQCETAEKRSEMFHLGGEEILSPTGIVSADLLLPLPWSTACGEEKLPIDTNMLSSPIYVTVNTNIAQQWIGGSGVKPSAFRSANILCRMGDMSNKDQSLGPYMKRDPTLIYGYPFIHTQTFSIANINFAQIDVPLTSILNADLVGLIFGVVKASDYQPSGGNSPNPFNYQELVDIQILYNGQVMSNFPGQSYKLQSMHSSVGANYFYGSVINPGAVAPFTSFPVNSYPIFIDFSRKRTPCYTNHFANVWRIGNNVLQLRCNVASGVDQQYICFVTYLYNGIADVQNGETRLYY